MLCDPLTPIVMDTKSMNKYFSNKFSCNSNIDVLQFLKRCKSDICLKIFVLVEKDLYMDDLIESA